MTNPLQPRNAAQKNAEHYFRKAEEQPAASGIRVRRRKRTDTVTIAFELRELRLAKATAAAVTDGLPAEKAEAEPGSQRKRSPARSILRMSY